MFVTQMSSEDCMKGSYEFLLLAKLKELWEPG